MSADHTTTAQQGRKESQMASIASLLTSPAKSVEVLAWSSLGKVAAQDGMVYFLTPCCDASGKGGEHGVICRKCYRPVTDMFGWGVWAHEDHGPAELAEYLRPVLEQFADGVAASVFEKARQ